MKRSPYSTEPPYGRILRGLEKRIDVAHGVREVPLIRRADREMNLACEAWADRRPVALEDVSEIGMVAPVLRDAVIDGSGALVPDHSRIAVGGDRAEHRLHAVPESRAATVVANRQLEQVVLFHGDADVVVFHADGGEDFVRATIADAGPGHGAPRAPYQYALSSS